MVATKQKSQSSKKNSKTPETSISIKQDVEAFLKSGGQIEIVGQGISGRESMASKKPNETTKT